MDSPRMADSPTMGSPLLGSRWLSASPAIRDGSGRRRSIPRYARDNKKNEKKEKKPNAGQIHAQGLGLLPQPVKDTVGGLVKTIDGVVAGLPIVGSLLGHTIGDTGKGLLDALDVKDKHSDKHVKAAAKAKPAAPPMARSIAHIDAQDDEGDNSENGPPRTFPRRQLAPPAIQLPAPANAATSVAGGMTGALSSTVSDLPAKVDNAPFVGPIVGELVQTVADIVGSVGPRALPATPPEFLEQALPVPMAPPSTPDPAAALEAIAQLIGTLPTDVLPSPAKGAFDTVTGTPGSMLRLRPRAPLINDPLELPAQVVSQAVNKLPDPVGGVVGGVAGSALGPSPGDKSPADLAAGTITSVPVSLPIPGSALRDIERPWGKLAGTADAHAQDALSTATGAAPTPPSAPALPEAPAAPAPPTAAKGRRGLTDMLNGTPFSVVANTLTGTLATTPLGGALNTVSGVVNGSPAGGVPNTISQMASNLPIASVPNTVMGTAAGTPAGDIINNVAGAASGLPIAGTLSTVTGTIGGTPAGVVMNTAGGMVKTVAGIAGGVPVAGATSGGILGGAGESGSDVGAKGVDGEQHHRNHHSSSSAAPSATMSM